MIFLLELTELRDVELLLAIPSKLPIPPAQKAAKNNAPQPFQSQLKYATAQIRENTIATNLSFMLVSLCFK